MCVDAAKYPCIALTMKKYMGGQTSIKLTYDPKVSNRATSCTKKKVDECAALGQFTTRGGKAKGAASCDEFPYNKAVIPPGKKAATVCARVYEQNWQGGQISKLAATYRKQGPSKVEARYRASRPAKTSRRNTARKSRHNTAREGMVFTAQYVGNPTQKDCDEVIKGVVGENKRKDPDFRKPSNLGKKQRTATGSTRSGKAYR
ncbi:hypothetical protein HDU67_004138 [Dinochytrium kinnereticum]|nr:hypothetical protein HDU67_004138 [Dinochytrium kinnereticum]